MEPPCGFLFQNNKGCVPPYGVLLGTFVQNILYKQLIGENISVIGHAMKPAMIYIESDIKYSCADYQYPKMAHTTQSQQDCVYIKPKVSFQGFWPTWACCLLVRLLTSELTPWPSWVLQALFPMKFWLLSFLQIKLSEGEWRRSNMSENTYNRSVGTGSQRDTWAIVKDYLIVEFCQVILVLSLHFGGQEQSEVAEPSTEGPISVFL